MEPIKFIETLENISNVLSFMDEELKHLRKTTIYTLNIIITLKTHTKTLIHYLDEIDGNFSLKTDLLEICDFIEFTGGLKDIKEVEIDVSSALALTKKCIVYCKYLLYPLEQQRDLEIETDPLVTPLIPFLKEKMGIVDGWYCICM